MIAGEILSAEKAGDLGQNLIIWVIFTDETGKEHPFYQTQNGSAVLLQKDGHNVWPLVCMAENFIGKTDAEIEAWAQVRIEKQAQNVIRAIARPVLNDAAIKTPMPKLIGKKWSVSDADFAEALTVTSAGVVTEK